MACTVFMAVALMLASAVVQARLTMKVLDDGASMMKNPSAMLTELEGMIRSKETPALDVITTIKSLIHDDIMPCLESTREAAAQETTNRLSAFQLCNNKSKIREGEIEGEWQVLVNNARSNHTDCREEEKGLYYHNLTGNDSYCVKLGEFFEACERCEFQNGSDRGESVQYVKAATLTEICALSEVTELDNGCTAQESQLASKKAECDTKQASFELDFCTWKVQLESNCKELDACYSRAEAAYNNHIAKTAPLVEKWNVETAALQKILCYCSVWLSEKDDRDDRSKHDATQFDVCKDQTHTPGPVNYGTPTAKAACLLSSVANHPGTSGFLTHEYYNFSNFVEIVVPCTQATTDVPTI